LPPTSTSPRPVVIWRGQNAQDLCLSVSEDQPPRCRESAAPRVSGPPVAGPELWVRGFVTAPKPARFVLNRPGVSGGSRHAGAVHSGSGGRAHPTAWVARSPRTRCAASTSSCGPGTTSDMGSRSRCFPASSPRPRRAGGVGVTRRRHRGSVLARSGRPPSRQRVDRCSRRVDL